MNTLTDIRARIAQVRTWDHDDAHPETLEKINALADDTAALADLVESRNAFSLTPGSILVLRDTWGLAEPGQSVHLARLAKTLKRWKVGLLVLPPDPAQSPTEADRAEIDPRMLRIRDLTVNFLRLPLASQLATLRKIGIEVPDTSTPRELRDGMPALLAQVRERGLIEELTAAVADAE